MQSENRHQSRYEIQRFGGGEDRTSAFLKFYQIDDGKRHHIKRKGRRGVDGVTRIGRRRVHADHEEYHAAHRNVEKKQEPCRPAVTAAFIVRVAFIRFMPIGIGEPCAHTAEDQIIYRGREGEDREIQIPGDGLKSRIEKTNRHTAVYADASAEGAVVQVFVAYFRESGFADFLHLPASLISFASCMISKAYFFLPSSSSFL